LGKRQREYDKRESIKKRIQSLWKDLSYLELHEPKQLNLILGFNEKGLAARRVQRGEREGNLVEEYFTANDLAFLFLNHTGWVDSVWKDNSRLYQYVEDLKTELRHRGIKTEADISLVTYELSPHKLWLSNQFLCPKCKKPGLPLNWEGKSFWCHFSEPEYKPRINICPVPWEYLDNWWKNAFYEKKYENCFLFVGRTETHSDSSLMNMEMARRYHGRTAMWWNSETGEWEGGLSDERDKR